MHHVDLKNIKDLNLTRLLSHNRFKRYPEPTYIIADKNTVVFPIHTTLLPQKATFTLKKSEFQKFVMSESIYKVY